MLMNYRLKIKQGYTDITATYTPKEWGELSCVIKSLTEHLDVAKDSRGEVIPGTGCQVLVVRPFEGVSDEEFIKDDGSGD